MLLLPMLTFCVLCALSVAGVVLGADGYEAESRLSASSTALDWVRHKHARHNSACMRVCVHASAAAGAHAATAAAAAAAAQQ